MKQTILLALLLSVFLAFEVHSKDVRFCMPPVASFTQNVRTVAPYEKVAKTIKVQYDINLKKQRMDTYTLADNLVASQLIVIDSSNNTLVYLIFGKSCVCYNNGQTGMDAVFSQCISQPVLGKSSIADLTTFKVGTSLVSGASDSDILEDIYFVTPTKEAGSWWFLSRVEYETSQSVLTETLYTDHSLSIEKNALTVPANCPKVCHPK